MLVFTATPGYLASGRSWWPWGVLFAGLLLTGLVTGYFMISARNIRLLSEVTIRLLDEVEEHKKTQDALSVSEELYQTFIDASNDIVFLKDEQFRYRIVNKGYLKYIGREEKEVIGKTGNDFRPPEITEQCDRSDMKVVESNALAVIEESSGDRIFETRKFPVMLGGNKTGIGCFMRDITEKKMTEKKLLESEDKYRSIFENAVEGIFQTTLDGHILSANNAIARMLGFSSPEELMEEAIDDLPRRVYADPDDRKKFIKVLEEQGTIAGFEVQLKRKDGGTIWVSLNTRTVKGNTGDILYLEGTVEDITSRKLAEEGLKRTLEKLRKTLAGTIQAVSLTVEARDPYTAGHQKRVAALAKAIAQEMGLPADTVDNIRIAGVVHDIGKISIPAETLSKPTQLTDIEFSLIKVHPQSGYDILKEAELPCPVAQIVLQHHERMNGSGYPDGLKGEQILLEARILAVADVVEAISSYRPYRPSKGIDAALEEIEKNKAVLYDIEVAGACLRLFREKGFQLEMY